jgi:hypothetical protein
VHLRNYERREFEPTSRQAPELVVNLEVLTRSPAYTVGTLTMNCVGVDLHKKTIVVCVLNQDRRILARRTFACGDPDVIAEFFRGLVPFQAVVEAAASYEWLIELIEP